MFAPPYPDSFPFSGYPMFSRNVRHAGHVHMAEAWGEAPDGTVVILPPEVVATGELLQAHFVLRHITRRPARDIQDFCRHVARRLVMRYPDPSRVRHVFVGIRTYDPVKYFTEHKHPLQTQVLARCPVPT